MVCSIKIIIALALVAACSTIGLAQQPPTPVAEYTIKIAPVDVDLIAKGLQTQPFGEVFPLMNKLRTQIVEQQEAAKSKPIPDPNGGTASGSSSSGTVEKK